jgi:hypothetical protein
MTRDRTRPPLPVDPRSEAARLRREAKEAKPERQAYLLWLATEWDKAAERVGGEGRGPAGG